MAILVSRKTKFLSHLGLSAGVQIAAVIFASAASADPYGGKYTPCVDYYALGESPCQVAPLPSQPVAMPQVQVPKALPEAKKSSADPVDQYLQNYGKPPREFVEFYLNPTQENAQKWVATYSQMVQKSQSIARTWSQAETAYKEAQTSAPAAPVAAAPRVAPGFAPASPSQVVPVPPVSFEKKKEIHLGAFAEGGAFAPSGPLHITYYFSASCPFCAKMTPDLNNLFNSMNGKLTLTCVDVTPLSPTQKAAPENIAGKLPCNWRLPEEGEVEAQSIHQTPTLHLRSPSGQVTKLSGYVPPSDLAGYLARP